MECKNDFDRNLFARYPNETEKHIPEFINEYIYYPGRWKIEYKGLSDKESTLDWYPGGMLHGSKYHEWYGPNRKVEVMLIGDWPRPTDRGVTAADFALELLEPIFDKIHMPDNNDVYYTNLIKFAPVFYNLNTIPAGWFKSCKPFLDKEIELVQPKYIVCMGTAVAKCILGKSSMSIEDSLTSIIPYEYVVGEEKHVAKVLVTPAMNSLVENRGAAKAFSLFRCQMKKLISNMSGIEDEVPTHIYVDNASDLKAEVDRIIRKAQEDPTYRIIAVDMEWEGDYPEQEGAKLLTVQFSAHPGEATVVILNGENGAFKPNIKAATKELNRLFTWHNETLDGKEFRWMPRIGGHFLRADLPWLMSLGITGTEPGKDIRFSYAPCGREEDLSKYRSKDGIGGFDTSLMYHAYNEKDNYGLKYLVAKENIGVPRYDTELHDFLEKYVKEHKLKKSDLKGFGCVPDSILHPYAAWDADATRRLAELCMFGWTNKDGTHRPALLDRDYFGLDNWKPYWRAHRASLGFLDIEQTGLMLDKERFQKLSDLFARVYEILLDKLRHMINWPDFNPSSVWHKQGFLFGRQYAVSVTVRGSVNVMPEDARSLNLTPEYTTQDRKPWSKAIPGKDTPATDKTVLNLLAQKYPDHPEVGLFRDICKLKTALSSPLSYPVETWDGKGKHILYPQGLYSCMRNDGAIHSHMRVLLATGRASSSDPNLQNIGKSAEATFQRILGYEDSDGEHGDYLDDLGGPRYLYPIRTVLRARPDHVFIESDFTGAELAVMAWISEDPNMIEHVRRNALPESDPDYYDIHSHIAVKAFKLDCEPTKKGLASIHAKHLRVAAKAVVFGIPYGRGARAIALQCRADGVPITDEEANGLVQSYYDMYPKVRDFLNKCKAALDDGGEGYVESLFERRRRFRYELIKKLPEELIAAEKREACNAPIQSTVADAVNVAIFNLLSYRFKHPEIRFKIVMQIHDALLIEVHKDDAALVYSALMKDCMVDRNPIKVGKEGNVKEYHFAIESDMYVHWGEPITEEIAQKELGCSLDYLMNPR